LNPGAFSGEEAAFREFVDDAFAQISAVKPERLILDLRNNAGGDDAFSDYLVSYLADRPFRWNHHFTVRTSDALKAHARSAMNPDSAFTAAILAHDSGALFRFDFGTVAPQPAEKRYSGKVFALINRQTHSQSAVAAAQLQDYGWALLVGEETAESPTLYASVFPYTLPETGITVQISKGQIVRVSGQETPGGVVPDILIRDHLLDDQDEVLAGLLSRLAAGDFD
jgi:C-terminal processing protease CtpA/Prc